MVYAIHSRIGPYVLQKLLGQGSDGTEVWLAQKMEVRAEIDEREMPIDVPVALKLMPHGPRTVEELREEWHLGRSVHDANVVQIRDVGVHNQVLYIAMEYVDGWTLSDIIQRARSKATAVKMPLDAVLGLAFDLASALCAIHQTQGADGRSIGLVHRDIKPSNLMVSKAGQVKILDLGIARSTAGSDGHGGRWWGTPGYMSPEQEDSNAAASSSDIFSAGLVLWEFRELCGPLLAPDGPRQKPHVRSGAFALEARKELPDPLGAIVQRCLESDPRKRFQNGKELLSALENCRVTGPGLAGVARLMDRKLLPLGAQGIDWEMLKDQLRRPWVPPPRAPVPTGIPGILSIPPTPGPTARVRPPTGSAPTVQPSPPPPFLTPIPPEVRNPPLPSAQAIAPATQPPAIQAAAPQAPSTRPQASPFVVPDTLPPSTPAPQPTRPYTSFQDLQDDPSSADPGVTELIARPGKPARQPSNSPDLVLAVLAGLFLLLVLLCGGGLWWLYADHGPVEPDPTEVGEEAAVVPSDAGIEVEPAPVPPACEDADHDGFLPCASGAAQLDCDDTDAAVHPGAVERCDGRVTTCGAVLPLVEADVDQDGFMVCIFEASEAAMQTLLGGDCDDNNPLAHPGAEEAAGGADLNCDGIVSAAVTTEDKDRDGFSPPADCNDRDRAIRPGATERPADGVDSNCDKKELCYVDGDGDHYGSESTNLVPTLTCLGSPGVVAVTGDCNDALAQVNPGVTVDGCGGSNEDCDTQTDEDCVPSGLPVVSAPRASLADGEVQVKSVLAGTRFDLRIGGDRATCERLEMAYTQPVPGQASRRGTQITSVTPDSTASFQLPGKCYRFSFRCCTAAGTGCYSVGRSPNNPYPGPC